MRKLLHIAVAMFCVSTAYAVPVTPATIPHVTFNDPSGAPCVGCQLFSYAAGTSTALATYTDATGTSVNPNPTVLGVDGGANVWLGRNSYKFVLKDATGSTIWTVDQVNAATLFPCGPANTVQFANTGTNGLDCDSIITIDKINHTLSVGVMNVNHVTIGALGTPTSWFLDTTTPATACASMGCATTSAGTAGQLAYYATTGSGLSGTFTIPDAITATTRAPGDNSNKLATTTYVKFPGAINPVSIQLSSGTSMTGNQGNGLLLQHSTGTTTTNNCAKFDANGNVVDAGVACGPTGGTDYYFSFTGCTLAVSGNSTNCQGNVLFSSVSPVVPSQPDANYYLGCTTNTGVAWGTSTGINTQSTSGFQYAENVDRYNGISATVTPTVWCHLHHN